MLKAHLKTDTKENVPQMVAKTLAKGGASFKVEGQEIVEPEEMVFHIKALYDNFSQTLAELDRLGIL